jgi:type IV conjugative transfer system coupling protein TraD
MQLKNTDKAKQFTRGGQITFHNIRMLLQVNKTVWNIYLPSLLILVAVSIYVITPNEILQNAWYWCLAQINPTLELLDFKLANFKVLYHGKTYSISPKNYLSYEQFVKNAEAIIHYLKSGAVIGFILSLGVFYALVKWLMAQGEKQTANQFIRGAKLDTSQNVAKMINKQKDASDIVIDDLPIVADSETRHFLVHGSTGTGKTQLISKILDHLRRRGDRVFLYDKGGVYTSTFYRKDKDKILNPFDARCENWDLWREATASTDFENMAESLIPMHGETDPFWVNAARTIFGSAAFTMQDNSDRSIKKLLKVLLTSELSDLHSYLSGTEAATLTSDKIEKTAISIRSVITTYLKSLRFMTAVENNNNKKPTFCIRDWICNEKTGKNDGWLFLSSNATQHASLKPLLSMWFSMATIALLALPENSNRRIWFVCDELPSLHKLPQLSESIAEARKYGGCFVLGMQNYAQLEKVYGRSAGKEIFDLMNTAFFFRSPSPDMAELVSRALGEQEIEDMRENYSYGANTIRDGISIGAQRMVNQIVSPAEIMDLESMKCYVRLAGSYPISLLELTLNKRPPIARSFIQNKTGTDKEVDGLIDQYDSNIRNFQVKKKPGSKNQEQKVNNKKQESNQATETSTDKNDTVEINQPQNSEEDYEL